MFGLLAAISDVGTILFIVLPIVGSGLLALGIYQVIEDSRKVNRRKLMDRLKGDSRSRSAKEAASILKRTLNQNQSDELFGNLIGKLSFVPKLQTLLDQANVRWSASRVIFNLTAMAAIAFMGLLILHFGIFAAVGCALAILLGPIFYLSLRRKRRMGKLTNQLPDVFAMMSQALRAGHGLASAIQLIHEQMPDRVDSLDVRFFVTAVLIQRQTGGDLAEVLDKIGEVIQQRIELFGLVKGLTAEGRLSGWVLFSLPIVVFMASLWLNPGYAKVLYTDPRGKLMLGLAIGMQIMGMALIRWIVNIKV